MEEKLLKIVQTTNSYLSDYVLMALLLFVGIFYSIKTNWVQIRYFKAGMKKLFGDFTMNGEKNENTLTSFQAATTAIAAQVGTGNIIGASGAILAGGPGAIFWMWIIAFLGMATSYAEATLAVKTRKVNSKTGEIKGGPIYYIQYAFKNKFGKFLASFFSICAVLALGFFGAMIPSNSIANTFETAFNIKPYIIGIMLVILTAFILFGGMKTLASVLEKIVPIMAIVFIVGSIMALILNINKIPETFGLIFKYAFHPEAILGGGVGAGLKIAISQGVKRGLYSNEAGMGSTPHAHALANVKRPHDQGIVAMMGVFIDTFIVLTLNAVVIISCLYTKGGKLENGYYGVLQNMIDKTNLAQIAFGNVMGEKYGSIFIAICILFFAYSTILGWNLFAKTNMEYIFGKKSIKIFYVISLIFVFIGTITSNDLVWELQDMFDQLLVIPNVFALVALYPIINAELKSVKKDNSIKVKNNKTKKK